MMFSITNLEYHYGLDEEQLKLNQDFIDLVYEYCDDNSSNYYVDAKELLKYMWNRGFKITSR